MAGLIAWSAGDCSDKHLWMASVGRRHGSEALGHLPVEHEASGRDLLQETRQNLWSRGPFPGKHGNTGIHFQWNLLLASLGASPLCSGSFAV